MPAQRTKKRASSPSPFTDIEPLPALAAAAEAQRGGVLSFATPATSYSTAEGASLSQASSSHLTSPSAPVIKHEGGVSEVAFDSPLAFEVWDPNAPKIKRRPKGDGKPKAKKGKGEPTRPPNAFILFRASFVKQGVISPKVESNSAAMSKIVGNTWRLLTDDQKVLWEAKAEIAAAEFRAKHPQYATTTPALLADAERDAAAAVGSEDVASPEPTEKPARKRRRKVTKDVKPQDDERCERIAQLLVSGVQGTELEGEVAEFDAQQVPAPIETRFEVPLVPMSYRRSSSAPAIAAAGEQSRFYVPTDRTVKSNQSPRSSSADLSAVKEEAMSPQLAAAEISVAMPPPPVQVDFNLDVFGQQPSSYQPLNMPTTLGPPFEFDFTFQPSAGPTDSSVISPLTSLYRAASPFGLPEVFAPPPNADPSMPPLVERPYDPLTDAVHLAPRLSINTLDQLDRWGAQYGEPQSPWGLATPPPLSANSTFDFGSSMPGTPADDGSSWAWPTVRQQIPQPQQQPTMATPVSLPMPPASMPGYGLELPWPAFATPVPAPINVELPSYGGIPGYEYANSPVSAHTPAFSPRLAKSADATPSYHVHFGFPNYFEQPHAQATSPTSAHAYSHPHTPVGATFF